PSVSFLALWGKHEISIRALPSSTEKDDSVPGNISNYGGLFGLAFKLSLGELFFIKGDLAAGGDILLVDYGSKGGRFVGGYNFILDSSAKMGVQSGPLAFHVGSGVFIRDQSPVNLDGLDIKAYWNIGASVLF